MPVPGGTPPCGPRKPRRPGTACHRAVGCRWQGGSRRHGFSRLPPVKTRSPFAMPVSLSRGIEGTASRFSEDTVNRGWSGCKDHTNSLGQRPALSMKGRSAWGLASYTSTCFRFSREAAQRDRVTGYWQPRWRRCLAPQRSSPPLFFRRRMKPGRNSISAISASRPSRIWIRLSAPVIAWRAAYPSQV